MFKIMIVDDEVLERQALKIIIEKLDKIECIIEACNGREAIELNKKYDPNVIIMDVKMPGIDGIKAAQIIKNERPGKVIIIITAYDDFDIIHKALVIGVNDYILKPVRPSDFIKVLTNSFVNLKTNEVGEKKLFKTNNQISYTSINPAIDYIKNNLHKNIKLEQMASLCNLSPCYFSKLFKKETGINFSNYINQEKITRARELLKNSDTPILNLALDLGFEDCGYFIRVFKKYEGITPKKYREINMNI